MGHAYRVPLRDVLKIDTMAETTILAGRSGLDRVVTRLNVMEVPDIVDWVRPHALLVTAGYPLVGLSEERFVELLRALDERQVAALGVKVGRYLDAIPPGALDVADDLGFPVLALSADMAFDDLLEQVHVRLTDVQADVLHRTDALHAALEGLVLEGAGLGQIATRIADVLGIGILVTTVDGRELAGALTGEMRETLTDADLFDATGRFRVERLRVRPMTIGSGQVLVQPVVAASSDLARLVAFDPERVVPKDDVYALQRASAVAALLISQQQAVNAVESKYRGDFLRDVLSGRAGGAGRVQEYAAGLGWSIDLPAMVVTAKLDPAPESAEQVPTSTRRAWQERFFQAWNKVVASHGTEYPSADFFDEVVSVLSVPERLREDPKAATTHLQAKVADIVTDVAGDRGGRRRPFSVGTSRLALTWEGLPAAYGQARRANEVGYRFTGGSGTSHFDELGIHRLIGLIPDRGEMEAFAADILGELAEETPEAESLRETLQVLLDTNLNVAEASRIQFVHYNTMRYRITKLEQLLGQFTTDAALRLNLAVALQVRKFQL